MRFDDVIEEIGGFGRYQKLQYFLVCLFGFPAAFQTMVTVFIMDTPDHRCEVPGINDTYKRQNEAHTIAVDAAVPRDEDGAYSTCELYRNGNQTEECNRWVYSRDIYEETVISEFDIVCDNKILKTHANMALMGGLLGGSLIMGILSDLIGRKKTLLLSVVMNFGASLSASFMRNFWAFVALRILTTFSGIGMFMTSFVIGMELVGPQQRVIAGIVIELFWAMGLFVIAGMAFAIRNWHHLAMALSIPTVLFLSYYWFIPESARWLLAKGRKEEASAIIRHAAKMNKVDVSEKVLSLENLEEDTKGEKIWHMFTTPSLLCRVLVIYFNWAVVSMVYYGLGLNVSSLSGDIFLNFTISAIVEAAAYFFCLFLLDRAGRKILHCSTMCLSGVACIGMIFPVLYGGSSLNWLTITLSMIGRFGNAAAFAIIYVFSAELFPTVMRNSGMGSSSFFARIGGMLSPYIADLGELVEGDVSLALPAMIFGVLSLAAGLLAFILPETRNRNLPETVEDAQNFGRETPGNLTSPEKYITGLDKMDKSDNGITLQAYNKPA